jgi:hypothetical protein
MAVFRQRQRIRYLEAILPLTATSDAEKRKIILDSYFKELFPYEEVQTWKENTKIQEMLQREMDRGPVLVQSDSPLKT